jgi:hypothetical protein
MNKKKVEKYISRYITRRQAIRVRKQPMNHGEQRRLMEDF